MTGLSRALHAAALAACAGGFVAALLRLLPGGAVPSARAILDESLYLGLLPKTNHPLL